MRLVASFLASIRVQNRGARAFSCRLAPRNDRAIALRAGGRLADQLAATRTFTAKTGAVGRMGAATTIWNCLFAAPRRDGRLAASVLEAALTGAATCRHWRAYTAAALVAGELRPRARLIRGASAARAAATVGATGVGRRARRDADARSAVADLVRGAFATGPTATIIATDPAVALRRAVWRRGRRRGRLVLLPVFLPFLLSLPGRGIIAEGQRQRRKEGAGQSHKHATAGGNTSQSPREVVKSIEVHKHSPCSWHTPPQTERLAPRIRPDEPRRPELRCRVLPLGHIRTSSYGALGNHVPALGVHGPWSRTRGAMSGRRRTRTRTGT
jgi:hypothetical protein